MVVAACNSSTPEGWVRWMESSGPIRVWGHKPNSSVIRQVKRWAYARPLYNNVHNFICNSKNLETTLKSFSGRIDEQLWYIHIAYFYSPIQNKTILIHTTTSMDSRLICFQSNSQVRAEERGNYKAAFKFVLMQSWLL
jgi:hypothetical protein